MKRFLLMTLLFLPTLLFAEGWADSLKVALTFEKDSLGLPVRRVYDETPLCRDSVFFVISKVHQEHICVYEKRQRDTVLLAAYPCCLSAIRGQKAFEGDCRTPESWPGKPFKIWRISDLRKLNLRTSEFRMFGPYYHALKVPGVVGVGIHGTNSPSSIAHWRRSHGCIRLLNEDVTHMVDHYSAVGNQVIILPEKQGPLPFEERALRVVCGLESLTGMGHEMDCFKVCSPCHLIHINPGLDIRQSRLGL